ncbi:MAG: hypothetical protein HYX53_05625 [Chloroflexi bacterium]|nr:hypothetical protein [Chloroflexota bacterium]
MLFDLIFLGVFTLGWLISAYIPWLALSIATRGRAGLVYLPLCLFSGVVAALAVPVLGFDGRGGLALSFAAAFTVPAALLAARRLSLPASSPRPRVEPEPREIPR